MSSITAKPPLIEADGEVLAALHRQYPGARRMFDEYNIAVDAPRRLDLAAIQRAVDPSISIDRRRWALGERDRNAVARWIENVDGRPGGGWLLRRNRVGWCHISPWGPK